MKKYLITGVLTLLPIVLTFMIVSWLVNLFTAPFVGVIEQAVLSYEKSRGISFLYHENLTLLISRALALILLFFLILLLGVLGRKLFFNFLLALANRVFSKIPLVKTIYKLSKEITKAMFAEGQKTFKRSVLVPFPTERTHAIGFVTGEVPAGLKRVMQQADLTVFVPTSPHPISGFLLLVSKENALEVDVSIEDAFKFLLSCGIIHPPSAQTDRS